MEEDHYGNIETNDNSTTITASLSSGSGPLVGMTTVIVKGGVATFKNLADDTAETIVLNFSGAGLTAGPSSTTAISPAQASQLVFHTEPPATATAVQPFTVAPLVDEEDRFGNLEVGDNFNGMTATVTSGGSAYLRERRRPSRTAWLDSPVSTMRQPGPSRSPSTGGGLASVPSSTITISPGGSASEIVFGQQPTNRAAGGYLSPAVTVEVEDAFGNVVAAGRLDRDPDAR